MRTSEQPPRWQRSLQIQRTLCLALLIASAPQSLAHTERQHLNVNPDKPASVPFSDAVLAGNTLYISGSGGFDPGTGKLPEDAAAEAQNLMEMRFEMQGIAVK